jgi:hypothetical protein
VYVFRVKDERIQVCKHGNVNERLSSICQRHLYVVDGFKIQKFVKLKISFSLASSHHAGSHKILMSKLIMSIAFKNFYDTHTFSR